MEGGVCGPHAHPEGGGVDVAFGVWTGTWTGTGIEEDEVGGGQVGFEGGGEVGEGGLGYVHLWSTSRGKRGGSGCVVVVVVVVVVLMVMLMLMGLVVVVVLVMVRGVG